MERLIIPVEADMSKADAKMLAFARHTSDIFEKKGFKLNIRKPDLPLGRITGDFEKFQGSLDAATARVLAFTATTTVIYGLSTAFTRLFTDSVKLEKQLAGIQAILNTSNSGLQQFGAELFKLANATGLSFDIAATAASEFARQGLSLEETLKATNAALVFSKIAGVDAAIAVENLTASVNTFSNEALILDDVSDIILSLDNAFAISAAGISDGLKRIGGVASESGLQLKEIASLISVVQQVSARGAPVISNGLKTIFTRLGRTKVQETLNGIGIATQNSNGEFRSQIDVLSDLSSKLETLSDSQRAFVLEQVAGVYQINTLQSTLKALSGEYSLYDKAVKIASDSAGNSAERLKILTATTDASIQRLKNNITQFLAETGKATVKPILDNFLGIGNKILESLNLGAAVKGGEEAGFSIGNVLLNGISAALSGPGTILLVVTVARLLNKITKDAFSALQTLAGLKKASLLDNQTQNSINQAIAQGNQGLVQRLATTTSIVEKTQILNNLLSTQAQTRGIAQINQAVSTGLAANKTNVSAKAKGRSKGYMPNYALGNIPSSVPKAQEPIPPEIKRKEKMDSLGGRYKSGKVIQVPEGYMSTAEIRDEIPGGGPNPWILPPLTQNGKPVKAGEDFREKAIRTKGIDPYKALGFIPNFALDIGAFTGVGGLNRVNNPKATEQFNKGQKDNVEWDDKISSVGFRIVKVPFDFNKTIVGEGTKAGKNLPNKKLDRKTSGKNSAEEGVKFEDTALSYLNSLKFGYKFKDASLSLYGKKTSAVDGYSINRGGSAKTNRIQLLEAKSGDWNPAEVSNKFGRFIPENINVLKSSLSPFFQEGVPDQFDTIRLENILAVPDVKKEPFEKDIRNRYRSSSFQEMEKERIIQQKRDEAKRERAKAAEDKKKIKEGKSVKSKKPVDGYKSFVQNLLKGPAPIRAEGFIPNFVSASSMIGRGAEGSFHKLTDDIGVKRFYRKAQKISSSDPFKGLEDANTSARNAALAYNLPQTITKEFAISKLLAENKLVPGVTGPQVPDNLKRALQAGSIRKQIIKEPVAFDSVGRDAAMDFGQILRAQLRKVGLLMNDLHGGNYTLNAQGKEFIQKNKNKFKWESSLDNPRTPTENQYIYDQFVKSGGKATIIDAGFTNVIDPNLKNKVNQYSQKTNSRGFIPNFASNPFVSGITSSSSLRAIPGAQAVPPPAQSSRIILPPKPNRINNTETGTRNNSNPRGKKEIAIDMFKGLLKAGAMVYARDGMLGDATNAFTDGETDNMVALIKGNAQWAKAWMGAIGVNRFVADAAKNGLRVAGSLQKRLMGQNRTSAAGFIPNFSSPLSSPKLSYTEERKAIDESIGAEMTSGFKRSEVSIGSRASFKNDLNPRGLAVFNDEEGTLSKGVSFAKMAKVEPTTKRTYGDSSSGSESITAAFGFIPNFATSKEIRAQKRAQRKKQREEKVAAQRARPALPSRLRSGLGGSFQATREIFERNQAKRKAAEAERKASRTNAAPIQKTGISPQDQAKRDAKANTLRQSRNIKVDYTNAKAQMAKLPQAPGRYQPTLTAQNQFVSKKEILKNLTQDRINKRRVGAKGVENTWKGGQEQSKLFRNRDGQIVGSEERNRKADSLRADRIVKRSMAAGIMTPGGKLGSPILPTKGIQGAGKGMQSFPRTQIENRFQVEKDARQAKANRLRSINNESRSVRKEYKGDFAKQKELNANQKGGISQGGGGQQGVNKQGAMPAGGGMPMGAGLPASDTQATKTPAQLKQEKKEIRATKSAAMSGKMMGAAFVASSVTGMLTTPAEGQEQTKGQKIGQNVGESIATGASVAMAAAMVPALAPVVIPLALLGAGLKFLHKANKDAVPSTVELTKNNKKLAESTASQITSVQEAVKAQGEISQLKESGGDPKKIAQAQAKFNKSLGGIKDKELISTLVNEKSDTKKQEAIMAFQEKKTKELNFSTGDLATNEIIKKSRLENTGILGTKTKTTDFGSENWDTFLNPIIDSIDFTKATSKEASAAIGKLGDGTMSMGDFISQFGSELGLSESQVKMASKTYGDLNTQFTSSSVQAMGKYAAALLDYNKTINETASQGIKGFSLDFQKVFDEGLKGLTLDTALINYQKFSKAGTNLGIDKNRLEIAKSSGSITEEQSITKSAEIETRQLGLENEKAGTAIVSDAVSKLTALVPKDVSIEKRSAILDQASSVLKGGGDLSSLENIIKQSLGAGDSSKELLSQIADINQDVVLGIEKLRIDQAEGVRSINTIAQDQLKESQRKSVAEIGRGALAGPPKYTNKLMNTGAVMETDAKIQKLRDKAEKSGGAKSTEGRKLLLEASNLEMQNDRVKYEDELAQAERYGKDNVVKRTSEGKSGAAQIQRNMAEDIGNKLRSLNASREKSGKAGIFSNEDIKKISEGIQIGGEGATESKRLLEEKLNNPSYAQDATVQGFAREIKDVGGKNSIFAGNAMAAAVSGPEKSLAQATGTPAIPTGPSVSSVTAGATAPVVAGTGAAGGGVPTLPSTTAVAAGAGAVAAVPTAIASTAMNPSSAALPNYASSTANITAKSLTGRGSEQADRLRRAAAVTQTQDYKSFEEERLRNQTLRQERDVAKAGKLDRMKDNNAAAGKIKASTRFTQVQSTGTASPTSRDVLIQDLADFQEKLNSGDDVTQTEFENLKASTLKDESGNARSRQEVATRNAYISQVESSGFKFTEDSDTIKKRIEEAQAKKEEKAQQGLDTTQEDTQISNLQKRDTTLNQDYDAKLLESDTRLAAKKERIDAAVSAAEGYNTDSARFLTEEPKIVTKTKSKTPEEMDSQVKRLQGLEQTAKLLGDGKKEDERIQRVEQDLKEGKQVVGKDGKIERVKMSPEQVAEAQKQLAGFKEDKNVNTVARQNNKRETARLKASVAEDPVQYLKSLQKQRGSEPIQNTSRIDDDIKRSQDNLKNGALGAGEDGKVKLTPLSPEERKDTEEYIKKRMADKKEVEAKNQPLIEIDNKIKAATAQAQMSDPKGYVELLRRRTGPAKGTPEDLKKGIQSKKDQIASLEKINPISADEKNQLTNLEKETTSYDKAVSNTKELDLLNKSQTPLDEAQKKRKSELETTSTADMKLIESVDPRDIQSKKKTVANLKERQDPKEKIDALRKEIITDERSLSQEQLIAEAQKKADVKDPAKIRASYVEKLRGSKDKNLQGVAAKIDKLDKKKAELASLKGTTLTVDDEEELKTLQDEVQSFNKADSNRKELDQLRMKGSAGTLTESDQERKKQLEATQADDAETLKTEITPQKKARMQELQGKEKNTKRQAELKGEIKKGTEDVARATDQNMGAINSELFKGQVAPIIMDQIQKPQDKAKVEAFNAKVVERQGQEAELDPVNKNIADIEAKRKERGKVANAAIGFMGEDKDGKKQEFINKFTRGEITAQEANEQTGGALKQAYDKVIPKKEGEKFEDLNNVGNIKDEKAKKALMEKNIAETKKEEDTLGAAIKPLIDAVANLTNAQGAVTEAAAAFQNAQGAQGTEGGAAAAATTNINSTSQVNVNITGEGITPEIIEKLKPAILAIIAEHSRAAASEAGKPPPASPPPKSPPVTTP